MRKIILVAAVAMLPAFAFAQGTGGSGSGGAGGAGGGAAGGSAGGAAGGTIGGSSGNGGPAASDGGTAVSSGGGDASAISAELMPRFRTYVMTNEVPSYTYSESARVGAILPEGGVTYREVPAEFGTRSYRYTVVNGTPVVVEPSTRRIVQIIQ